MPKCLAWFGSFFNGDMASMYKMWNVQLNLDTTNTRTILGLKYIEMERTFKGMDGPVSELGIM